MFTYSFSDIVDEHFVIITLLQERVTCWLDLRGVTHTSHRLLELWQRTSTTTDIFVSWLISDILFS